MQANNLRLIIITKSLLETINGVLNGGGMPLYCRLKRQEGLWQWETNSCHLAIPVTSYTVERSFLNLRRLKTYLRSTMSQDRLNHISILTCYNNKADCIDMKGILNSFVARNDIRAACCICYVS